MLMNGNKFLHYKLFWKIKGYLKIQIENEVEQKLIATENVGYC